MSPIKDKHRYPPDWPQIRARILIRAGNKCEICGIPQYSQVLSPRTGKSYTIYLELAHLAPPIEDFRDCNLKMMCPTCHNRWDAKMRAKKRTITKFSNNLFS